MADTFPAAHLLTPACGSLRSCGLLDEGWLLGACSIVLGLLLLAGVYLMLVRRGRYAQHRETLVAGQLKTPAPEHPSDLLLLAHRHWS